MSELERTYQRILFILNFIISKIPQGEFFLEFKFPLELTYKERNIKGMRMLYSDFVSFTKDFYGYQKEEFNKLFAKEFQGEKLADNRVLRIIWRVLDKKKISTKEEFRIISDFQKDQAERDDYFEKYDLFASYLGAYLLGIVDSLYLTKQKL